MSVPVRRHIEMPHDADEHLTGSQWVDGKPIYRRVISMDNGGNGLTEVQLDLSFIETVIRAEAWLNTATNVWQAMAGSVYIDTILAGSITVNHQGINMSGRPQPQCVIEYTKV